MADGVVIDSEGFSRDVAQFALLTGRSFADELKVQAKGVMRQIVKVTPPFNSRAGTVSAARKAGDNAISRDLYRVFRPVKLVGSRKITHLFGKSHPKAPWTVPTKEKYPDLASLYAQHRGLSSAGRRARYKNAYFVDEQKHKALATLLQKRVGFLGGGFAPGALALAVPLPFFMRRHAGAAPGRVEMRLTGDHLSIIIINDVAYAGRVGGFPARVERAVQTQRGAMARQLPFLLRRHERLVN